MNENAFARLRMPPNRQSAYITTHAIPLPFIARRPQMPKPHETVPVIRLTPDGLTPRAVNHRGMR